MTGSLSRDPYLRAFTYIAAASTLYGLWAWCLLANTVGGSRLILDHYIGRALGLYGLVAVLSVYVYAAYLLFVQRPERIVHIFLTGLRRAFLSRERLFFSFPVLLTMPVVNSIYTSVKAQIPQIVPFRYDELFATWDRLLHGGYDPWRFLHLLLDSPIVTYAISYIYHTTWFFLLYIVVLWHALGRHALKVRARFFLTYVLAWAVIGNAAAVLLSSAGPCYFEYVAASANPFASLMHYLSSVRSEVGGLNALVLQERLWLDHVVSVVREGSGISAMPSMHVAASTLFALAARQIGRRVGWLFIGYAAVTLVGAVHLGWHYALDGYAAIVLTAGLWWGAGTLLDRDRRIG